MINSFQGFSGIFSLHLKKLFHFLIKSSHLFFSTWINERNKFFYQPEEEEAARLGTQTEVTALTQEAQQRILGQRPVIVLEVLLAVAPQQVKADPVQQEMRIPVVVVEAGVAFTAMLP